MSDDVADMIRHLMAEAGLGHTFRKMTRSALQKAITKAKTSGNVEVKRGRSIAPVSLLETIQAKLERGSKEEIINKHDMTANSDRHIPSSRISTLFMLTPSPISSVSPPLRLSFSSTSLSPLSSGLRAVETVEGRHSATPGTPPAKGTNLSPAKGRSISDGVDKASSSTTDLGLVLSTSIDAMQDFPDSEESLSEERLVEVLTSFTTCKPEAKVTKSRVRKRSLVDHDSSASGESQPSSDGIRVRKSKRSRHCSTSSPAISAEGVEKEKQARKKEWEKERAEKVKKEREDFLYKRIMDRREQRKTEDKNKPANLVKKAMLDNYDNREVCTKLKALSEKKPNEEQISRLAQAKILGPHYLGRTASQTAGFRFDVCKNGSNGFTGHGLFMPAADINEKQCVHDGIEHLTQGEHVCMIGHHLMWTDLPEDEYLSFSKDPLFLVVHALDRHHENQSNVTIQFFDRRTAEDYNGKPAAFYPALALYDAFNVKEAGAWSRPQQIALHARKFTQEFLSHHTVIVKDIRFKQARIEDLIQDGLYELFPAFEVPDDHLRAGLYTGQVVYRTIGYPADSERLPATQRKHKYSYQYCATVVPFTVSTLRLVRKITRNFMDIPGDDVRSIQEPHLHVFLCFLTFQKRPRHDPIFVQWLRYHYTAEDVSDLYDDGEGGVTPGFTHVANNLPSSLQYLDLVRDAAAAFGLPEFPANVIETGSSVTGDQYADDDARLYNPKLYVKSTKYDRDEQLDRRDKGKKARQDKRDADKAAEAAGLRLKRKTKGQARQEIARLERELRKASLAAKKRARKQKKAAQITGGDVTMQTSLTISTIVDTSESESDLFSFESELFSSDDDDDNLSI